MKESKGNNIKLGAFVTTTIMLFILTIYFVGQRQQLFNKTFHISGIFKDISGLQVGNNVRFSGINVGIVDNIEQVTDSTVKVDMEINEDTRRFMKKNVQAVIGSDGLMGNKILLIVSRPGAAEILSDNDTIATTQQVTVDEILQKIKITAEYAATISGDLAVVTGNIKEGKGTIGKLLMDSTMAENVDDALVNIKKGAGGFRKNMDAASHNILLRGYIKKKEKQAEKAKAEKEKQQGKMEKE